MEDDKMERLVSEFERILQNAENNLSWDDYQYIIMKFRGMLNRVPKKSVND